MSFILEALRKSEAERRRGQSPDLLSQPLPMPQHARKPLPAGGLWLVALALSLVVVALLVWRWPQPASPTLDPQAADATNAGTPMSTVDTSAGVAAPAPSIIDAPDAQAAAARTMLQADPAVAEHVAPPPVLVPAAQQEVPAPRPVTQLTAVPMQRAGTTTLEPPQARAESMQPAPDVATHTPATASVEPAQDLAAATTARAQGRSYDDNGDVGAASAAVTTFSSPDLPLRLSDLSAEDRQQLPALRVSMHMWAPENERRFAIIDGSRVAEGDRVGEATIESIEADAVLLAWRGRRIRLAIR